RDTPILRGASARRRAGFTFVVAAVLLVGAITLPRLGGEALRDALAEPLAMPPTPPTIDLDTYEPMRAPDPDDAA
ncbi:MAG: hypothetical protein AAGE94_07810, partial [Acidobacteriota bacterium]